MISRIAYQMQSGKKHFLIIAALVFSLVPVLTGCSGTSKDSSGDKTVTKQPTLSGLSVSSGSLTPSFSSGTTLYKVSVANDVTPIQVTPTATAPDDMTIAVNGISVNSGSATGDIDLSVGNNTINIVVTSKINSENSSTYTVIVTRTGLDPTGNLGITVDFTNTEIIPSAGNILYIDVFYSKSSMVSWANDLTGTVSSDASAQVNLTADDITNGVTRTITVDTGADALYVCAYVDINNNEALDDGELVEFYEDIDILAALYWAAGTGGIQPKDAAAYSPITINLDDVFKFPSNGVIFYSIDGGATAILLEVAANYSSVTDDTYIADTNSEIIGFYFPEGSSGSFDQGDDGVDFFVIDSGNEYWMSGATTINVTHYGNVGGTITGNFSCVMTNETDDTDTITVTGTFSVVRVMDYD